MNDSPAYRDPLTRRIVEITDEDESILRPNAGTDGSGTIVFSRCGNTITAAAEISLRCRRESHHF